MRSTRLFAVAGVAALAAGLVACSKAGAQPTSDVAVSASDSDCALASTQVAAGVVKFSITN